MTWFAACSVVLCVEGDWLYFPEYERVPQTIEWTHLHTVGDFSASNISPLSFSLHSLHNAVQVMQLHCALMWTSRHIWHLKCQFFRNPLQTCSLHLLLTGFLCSELHYSFWSGWESEGLLAAQRSRRFLAKISFVENKSSLWDDGKHAVQFCGNVNMLTFNLSLRLTHHYVVVLLFPPNDIFSAGQVFF